MRDRRPFHGLLSLLFCLAVLAGGAVGCSSDRMYDGPKRSRDQIAVIKTSSFNETRIRSIDGKRFSYASVNLWPAPDEQMEIELLPGLHELVLYLEPHVDPSPARADETRRVEFESDGIYELADLNVIKSTGR